MPPKHTRWAVHGGRPLCCGVRVLLSGLSSGVEALQARLKSRFLGYKENVLSHSQCDFRDKPSLPLTARKTELLYIRCS